MYARESHPYTEGTLNKKTKHHSIQDGRLAKRPDALCGQEEDMQQNPYLDTDDDQSTEYLVQQPTTAYAPQRTAVPQQAPQAEQEKKSEGIAMAPVIGSALAAATSLLLTSRIGVGGAVVTAAVGAAVTTLTSQIYTRLATASAEKLRNVATSSSRSQLAGVMDSSELDQGYAGQGYAGQGYAGQGYGPDAYAPDPNQAASYSDGTRVAPASLRKAAARRHSKDMRKRGLIVTVIVALAAVLVAAGIVGLATAGEGIGPKTQPIIATTPTETNDNTDAQANATQDQSDTTQNSADASKADTTEDAGTATTDSTSKDTTSTNGGTSSNSTSNESGDTSASGQGTSGGASSNSDASNANSSSSSSTTGTTGADSGAADSGATSSGASDGTSTDGTTSSDATATTQSADTTTASGN